MTQTNPDLLACCGVLDADANETGHAAWIVSTSAMAAQVREHAAIHGLPMPAVVAIDRVGTIDCGTLIDYFCSRASTHRVFLALEDLGSVSRFLSAARACALRKPTFMWCSAPRGVDPLVYNAAQIRTGCACVGGFDALIDAFDDLERGGDHAHALLTRYRAHVEKLLRMPPLRMPYISGLRELHEKARARIDALPPISTPPISTIRTHDTYTADEIDKLDDRTASALLRDYGVPVCDRAGAPSMDPATRIDISVTVRDDPGFGPHMSLAMRSKHIDGSVDVDKAHHGVTLLIPVDTTFTCGTLEALPALARVRGDQIATIAYALDALSSMICADDRIGDLDLCLAADAGHRVCVSGVSIWRLPHGVRHALSIRPYPSELEETIDWAGHALTIRPIRPEDEPLHAGLFRAQSSEDLYLRFFSVQKMPDHARLARLVRIDYAREMALVACSHDAGTAITHGVVRAVTDADNEAAEFAVAIRSDEKGHHLGRILMDRIIAYCRSRGTRRLVGIVLKENHRMLSLAHDCGFTHAPGDDPTAWAVNLDLQR